MTLKRLLVHVGDDSRCENLVDAACGLARRSEATLVGLYVRPFPVVVPVAPLGGAMPVIEGLSRAFQQACATARKTFETITGREGVNADWHEDDGDVAERISTHGRYTDLTLVGQWSPDDTPDRLPRDLGALVALSTGRPVLVMPYAGVHELAFERVLLCWDGSREAARAAHDMMTLLPAATRIEIACVDPTDAAGRDPGSDVARLLAAHGFRADAHRIASGDISIADALLAASCDLGCDLIAMGAYGHSRVREIAFGGTTRAMIRNAPLPLLLSH